MTSAAAPFPLVAIDIGNSRVKLGLFTSARGAADGLPCPDRTLDLRPESTTVAALADWLAPYAPEDLSWWIGSVQRAVASRLIDGLRDRAGDQIVLLSHSDLPLQVALKRPDMVGVDRLLGAVAANRLRQPDRPAVIIDLGTAITVDLVSPQGAFLGGAIMPGIGLATRALHHFTDLLPLLDMPELAEPPPALGTGTMEALRSGVYWGAVGGVRHLIELLAQQMGSQPHVYLSGGAAPTVAGLLSPSSRYVPHLILAGIALAAAHAGCVAAPAEQGGAGCATEPT